MYPKDDSPELVILFVEDDPITRGMINKVICAKFQGVVMLEAENGKVGLEMFNRYKPKIVMTDIAMPILDGLEMAAEIKTLCPDTRIAVLSAFDYEPQYNQKANEIGVDFFLHKPIKFTQLFSALEHII